MTQPTAGGWASADRDRANPRPHGHGNTEDMAAETDATVRAF